MSRSDFLVILGLIILGIISRLVPHPPCFTPINAIILWSAYDYKNRSLALLPLLIILLVSDCVIGFYSTLPFVYLSFSLMILIGRQLNEKIAFSRLISLSLATSLSFFFITNFGVWMTDSLYPKTLEGLGICYLAGIPFLRNQILGDVVYILLLFSGFAYWKNVFRIKYAFNISQ
jgi:hypothetical protein